MKYFAHKTDDDEQTVKKHLEGVASLAEYFAADMFKSAVFCIGMAHDIGKYSVAFQNRLNGSNQKYEHSACGAIEYDSLIESKEEKVLIPMLEYCIAGHHTGLPDGGSKADTEDDSTLHGKLSRKKFYKGDSDYSAYKNEIRLEKPDMSEIFEEIKKEMSNASHSADKNEIWENTIELYAFFTRYLFSCLTDADFIDTERFCFPEINRNMKSDFKKAHEAVERKFSDFICDTPLKEARNRLQEQAYKNAKKESSISILNMPTGSGKTLCSLKIALDKLMASNGRKKRIIYVIPYTSIIEQTAEQFRKIFGVHCDIVEHHSNYCFDKNKDRALSEEETTEEKIKRACENWEAPVIITTSVQFFESLYHYKGSGLRKLHNIADSIIVFDEIHMLPVEYLQPCVRGIGYITKYLNSEAIFLSATMPDYTKIFEKYIPFSSVNELICDKTDFKYFKKCEYVYIGKTDIESIAEKTEKYRSNLIIVNTKKLAKEMYSAVSRNKYHLSTFMTPNDRSETIEKIRSDLENNIKVTVVSTSLIEAGVDLDFETVFRQMSGIDNILQSGGRCNREGKRESGTVYIFETENNFSKLQKDLMVRANITGKLIKENDDIDSYDCIKSYYDTLFNFKDKAISQETMCKLKNIPFFDNLLFKEYAENFKFIKDNSVGVVINNCDESEELLDAAQKGDRNARRKLQRYTVSLHFYGELDKAQKAGIIEETKCGICVLNNNDYYDKETGLDIDKHFDIIF